MKTFIAVAIIASLPLACTKPALQSDASRASSTRCGDKIPLSETTPGTAYLRVSLIDSAPPQLAASTDLFAQDIAKWARILTVGQADSLVRAERLDWTSLASALPLTIYRNQPISPSRDTVTPSFPVENGVAFSSRFVRAPEGSKLLKQAFDSVRAHTEPFFAWPNYPSMDSLRFVLVLGWEGAKPSGTVSQYRANARPKFELFHMNFPKEKGPVALKRGEVVYPPKALSAGFQAKVNLQFTIDSTGRPVPSTMKALWPAGVPKLEGGQAEMYESFVTEAKRSAMASRFSPATLGGCPIELSVQQPYYFEISK